MTVSYVFDTYAKTETGRIMHFDVVLDEDNQEKAIQCALHWLQSINHHNAQVTPSNCMFCHSLEPPQSIRDEINRHGYAIYKLEGCP